ncbi:hypothetical protein GCM10027413_27990 [Conyzicola nivalis]|uniref:PBP domain-containing protein n=1 Tax=Conyzicola nivalis TaxID=1477021 RepID=A0A916WN91_9MICO|nr:hypothetical protein [Conyzicola nivalis]GGB14630.1 hypothetical protein GCM10010979_31520 [Conyzicola nivalis]
MPNRPAAGAGRTRLISGITGVSTMLVVGALLTIGGVVIPAQTADAAVASTAATISATQQDPDWGNAPFPDLAVTVSQTKNLVGQGLVVSWTGGKKSTPPSGQTGGENFLQIMQCWGDAPKDEKNPDAPAEPDRTTCQYGGYNTPGTSRDSNRGDGNVVAEADKNYTAPKEGLSSAYTSIPFRAATGKPEDIVENVRDGHRLFKDDGTVVTTDVNNNKYFGPYTTNEVSWAGTGSDGTGSAKIELQTVVQSEGLGCGTPIEAEDGSVSGSSCWLVVIPRGTADQGEAGIVQSGLLWDTWKHKLAIKLDFRPAGVRCAIGASERLVAGSELAADAVASWQPSLCTADGGSVYTLLTGTEADAALAANGTETAPLALTSRALVSDQADTLAYAPIAVAGVAISFAVDREPADSADQSSKDKARMPFTSLNLNPRLVAKLLTNSYLDSLPYGANRKHVKYESAASPGHNARNITYDPEFLAINPEWKNQALVSPSLGDLLLPQGRSDGATALWTYVASDPAASEFLAGKPDEYGMVVNPYSSTDAGSNPTGTALEVPRDDFPKADPIEQPADGVAAPVNLVTWRPYTNNFESGGNLVLNGNGQVLGGWDPTSVPQKYSKTARSLPGVQRVLGLTDTSAAAKYQVFTAALLNPAGEYVTPTIESMTAGAAAMTASAGQSQVYGFDPQSAAALGAKTAYPLTLPVYAAASPTMADDDVRASYADFIRYAVTDGQRRGTEAGQLPEGYAPIPAGWKAQALAAAAVLESPPAPVAAPAPTPPAAVAPAKPAAVGTLAPVPVAPAPPTATGEAVLALAGKATPDDPAAAALQNAVPGSVLAGLLSALLVPGITRMKRKRL